MQCLKDETHWNKDGKPADPTSSRCQIGDKVLPGPLVTLEDRDVDDETGDPAEARKEVGPEEGPTPEPFVVVGECIWQALLVLKPSG